MIMTGGKKLTMEVTAEDVARDFLRDNGFVAIKRNLAEELAKCDGGFGRDLMVYDPNSDCYVWNQKVKHG